MSPSPLPAPAPAPSPETDRNLADRTDVVFYFQAHQPYRLRRQLPRGTDPKDAFDTPLDKAVLLRVAERCYRPMNALLLEAVRRTDGRFRCAFSLSGTLIQQLRDWSPETLDTFVALADSGAVEFLCETTHHSLAALGDWTEFEHQVAAQRATVEDLFGRAPTAFRDTELIVDESIARKVEELGFEVLLGEGAERVLGWRDARYVYRPHGCTDLKLLLRHYQLSDDIGFRFSNREWDGYPLFADTFAHWIHSSPPDAHFVGLFMDYETFGEHQWADTGIFDFMAALPEQVLQNPAFGFATPTELARRHQPVGTLRYDAPVSWADADRGVGAWLANPMQRTAHEAIYAIAPLVREIEPHNPGLAATWRRLTTSDHVYYMATAADSDGEVHDYFSPYDGPHDAFVIFMDVIDELAFRVRQEHARLSGTTRSTPPAAAGSGPRAAPNPGRSGGGRKSRRKR